MKEGNAETYIVLLDHSASSPVSTDGASSVHPHAVGGELVGSLSLGRLTAAEVSAAMDRVSSGLVVLGVDKLRRVDRSVGRTLPESEGVHDGRSRGEEVREDKVEEAVVPCLLVRANAIANVVPGVSRPVVGVRVVRRLDLHDLDRADPELVELGGIVKSCREEKWSQDATQTGSDGEDAPGVYRESYLSVWGSMGSFWNAARVES